MYESDNIKHQKQMRPAVYIKDRISNTEAMVLAVLAKKNISFSSVDKYLILILFDSAKMWYSGPNIGVAA